MSNFFSRWWYASKIPVFLYFLWPFSILYRAVQCARFQLYRLGWLRVHRFSIPVVVVTNQVVGGSGKTPLCVSLLLALKQAGYHPALVSRGYGGASHRISMSVLPQSDPMSAGDEPVLIAKRTRCPVVVDCNRVRAVQYVLDHFPSTNVIVSDDGGLHYAMDRQLEIMVDDCTRGKHNGFYLPLGPLRDPNLTMDYARLVIRHVFDFDQNNSHQMRLQPIAFRSLRDDDTVSIDFFHGKTVHAVAGIGHPNRFFSTLERLGIHVIPHVFPDHYLFSQNDFSEWERSSHPIIMTEKDAVKCTSFSLFSAWYLKVDAVLSENVIDEVSLILNKKEHRCGEHKK